MKRAFSGHTSTFSSVDARSLDKICESTKKKNELHMSGKM